MYRFFIIILFVLCACEMHFCIVHDIIYVINVLKIDENRCKQTEINLSLLWVLQVIESIPYLVQSIGQYELI